MQNANNVMTRSVENIVALSELNTPTKDGDYRDSNGLLHCGKCKAYLEYRINPARLKSPSNMTVDEEIQYNNTLKWFTEKSFRVPCQCKENERKEYERRVFREKVQENRYYCFGKTPRLMNYVFELDDARDSRVSIVSRRYVESFRDKSHKNGLKLLYWGDVGQGKTFLACAVANALISQGYTVKFTSIATVIAQAAQYKVPVLSLAEGLLEFDLVVLDDFGAEEMNERNLAKTYQIINTLSEHNVPLVITTNLSPERFNTPVNAEERRIFSRILEKCTLLRVYNKYGDRRKKDVT